MVVITNVGTAVEFIKTAVEFISILLRCTQHQSYVNFTSVPSALTVPSPNLLLNSSSLNALHEHMNHSSGLRLGHYDMYNCITMHLVTPVFRSGANGAKRYTESCMDTCKCNEHVHSYGSIGQPRSSQSAINSGLNAASESVYKQHPVSIRHVHC